MEPKWYRSIIAASRVRLSVIRHCNSVYRWWCWCRRIQRQYRYVGAVRLGKLCRELLRNGWMGPRREYIYIGISSNKNVVKILLETKTGIDNSGCFVLIISQAIFYHISFPEFTKRLVFWYTMCSLQCSLKEVPIIQNWQEEYFCDLKSKVKVLYKGGIFWTWKFSRRSSN